MSNLYRGPSIDASYQVSVHLAKRFQRRRFLKICQSETRIVWRPCLLMDRDEMSNLYRGPSIEASYQISDQLALRFQRRRLKCEKLTDNRRRTPSDGKSSHCLWQGELKSRLVHNLFHYGVWTMNWSSTGFFLTMCLDNIFLLFTNLRQNSQMYNFGSLQNSTSPYIQ
jgi:hypothetical protein